MIWKDTLHYMFLKKVLPRLFFNLVPKKSFAPKGTFSIGMVQKPDEIMT